MVDEAVSGQEPNIAELMDLKVREMKLHYEPTAVDATYDLGSLPVHSIAISMKRIADCMVNDNSARHQLLTGINSLCTILKETKEQQHLDAQDLSRALFDLDSTTRNNVGRELRITITKE